jgi:hypothetical protein
MNSFSKLTMTGVLAGTAVVAIALVARAGGDKVAFPADFKKGVLYTTVDRADNKQVREFFAAPAAIEAAKKGEPMPSGTVLTMVQYSAQLDPQGNPVKDANGRFMKGNLVGYAIMEKRTGWGGEYPDNVRNGEWEYQAFTPAMAVNDKANLTACFTCHKPLAATDYLFTLDKLKTPSK